MITAARRVALTCTRRYAVASSRGIVSLSLNSQPYVRNTQDVSSYNTSTNPPMSYHPIPSQHRHLSSSNLPYHIVVGMPALSPTMESGTISKWNVSAGDSFSAGDSLAVIETDKATIDFEAQDDGVVAKILVPEGGGELNVGSPIMVTVEEEGDVAKFENFVPETSAADAAPTAAAEPVAASTPEASTPAADLPYHLVVGMPALSPTMDAGTISSWNVSEGDSFSAGDSIAVIETDKASMDFEAQDDGVVAKLLVQPGSGEISVGVPIMVTVEEEADVAAFKDFVAESAVNTSATEASAPVPVEKKAAPAVVAPAPTPAAAPVVAPLAVPAPAVSGDAISIGGSSWGKLAAQKSPLAKSLAAKQQQYIEKYGSTGHIPIV